MIKYFLFVFIFPFKLFAQKTYADFIQQDGSIQWAAEYDQILNLTPKLATYSIRELAFRHAGEKGCIESFKVVNEQFQKEVFCLSDTLSNHKSFMGFTNTFRHYVKQFSYQSFIFLKDQSSLSFNKNAFKSKFQIDEVKQILYYKNSKFFITNSLVSPLYLKNVDDSFSKNPIFIWEKYYSVFTNSEPAHKLSYIQKKKLIDIGNASEIYNFRENPFNENKNIQLFTKSNKRFSNYLYDDILKGNITAVDAKNQIIPASKIFTVDNPAIKIKTYDEKGNVNGSTLIRNDVDIESLENFSISQHYYFDTIKNILLSEVNYVDFYQNKISKKGIDLGLAFFFRIYFIKPSLYKKPVRKSLLNDF